MRNYLLVDFGSTFTKLTAVDLDKEDIIATSKAITTVETNIINGYDKASINFEKKFMDKIEIAINLQRHYANEIYQIKDQLGTNVGSLVENLLS